MSEHMMPIPSRIYNAAVGGHVAGADQIIDDETGLTLDEVAGGALEEKEYTSGSDNGMGRVVLRKNLVNGVNTLVQTMINNSNTIYVIQYDFTLGEDITVPANCVLEFNGGSVSGPYTLYSSATKLIGYNKYSNALKGIFYTLNGEIVNGLGEILKPSLGFDYAATQFEAVQINSNDRYCQGIIHTGTDIYMLMMRNNSTVSYVAHWDQHFNYKGWFTLDIQNNHGGMGFYKDGYIYISSHATGNIFKYSANTWKNATLGSQVSGESITISGITSTVLMAYDDTSDTIVVYNPGHIYILDSSFNIIYQREETNIPNDNAHYVIQGFVWEKGILTILYSDRSSFESTNIVYYDVFNGNITNYIHVPQDYAQIEIEACCKYPDLNDTYIICANLPSINGYLIGKYSNIEQVHTVDSQIGNVKTSQIAYYLDNTETTKDPCGSINYPFKNLTSAYILTKNAILDLKVTPTVNEYICQIYFLKDARIITNNGSVSNKALFRGYICAFGGATVVLDNIQLTSRENLGESHLVVALREANIIIKYSIIDANEVLGGTVRVEDGGCIRIMNNTTLKGSTGNVANIRNGTIILDQDSVLQNNTYGISIRSNGVFVSPYFYKVPVSSTNKFSFDETTNILPVQFICKSEQDITDFLSFMQNGIGSPSRGIVEVIIDGNYGTYTAGVHLLVNGLIV